MTWPITALVLTLLLGVLGGCFLLAGVVSLNTVYNERSRLDGRVLWEKLMGLSKRDQWKVRREAHAFLPVVWAKQGFTRLLIYFGVTFLILARLFSDHAAPLFTPRPPTSAGSATPAASPLPSLAP